MIVRGKGPLTLSLSPKGEGTLGRNRATAHLSLWGRGRREAAGEGAFIWVSMQEEI